MNGDAKTLLIILFVIFLIADGLLITYTVFYYLKFKYNDRNDEFKLIKEIREKMAVLEEKIQEQPEVEETEEETEGEAEVETEEVVENNAKAFKDQFEELDDDTKNMYIEFRNYMLSLDNVLEETKKFDVRFKIGSSRVFATVTIENNNINIHLNMGRVKFADGKHALVLKPVNITVKQGLNVEDVKTQIKTCYLNKAGLINVNVEEAK